MRRREFLSGLLKASGIALGLGGLASLPYLYHSRPEGPLRYIKAADEEKIPRRGVREADFSFNGLVHKVFLARDDGNFFVLSPVCPHLGCLINWNYLKNEFDCPCHGSRFDIAGRVIGGPAPKPLTRLPYKIKGGFLYVGMRT